MLTALTILLASTTAHAADAQPFTLSTDVEAWPVTDIDSGWWPEEGPIRVRTVLFAEGIAGIDIEGDSIVESDGNGATHRLDHDAAEGEASIELNVDASLYLSIDVAGYTWEDILHEQTVSFDVSQTFDSFAFSEDGGASLQFPMDTTEVFEIDQGILPMVEVVVTGSLTPDADVTISTDSIETDDGAFTSGSQRMATSGGTMSMDALGTLTSTLNLVVQGHAEVCITWVDCYGDFNYDFQMDPINHSQDLAYEPVTVNHARTAGESGNTAAEDEEEAAGAAAGGCATVPVTEPGSLLVIFALAALAYRRRSS